MICFAPNCKANTKLFFMFFALFDIIKDLKRLYRSEGKMLEKKLIKRFYDIASDFNDSISLIAILLIINKKSEMQFHELKEYLNNLDFDNEILDSIEEIALNTKSQDMGRLIRLLSPIDKLFVREKPRDIPSVVTAGRDKFQKKAEEKK